MRRDRRVHRLHSHGPRIAAALLGVSLLILVICGATPIPVLGIAIRSARCHDLLPLLVGLAVNAIVERNCSHLRWRFASGVIVVGAATFLWALFGVNGPATRLSWTLAGEGLLASLFLGGVGGLLNAGLARAVGHLFGTQLLQDGTLCPNCAYIITHLPQPRCPECGRTFTEADLEPRPPDASAAWRRIGLAWVASAGVLVLVILTLPHVVIWSLASGRVAAEWPVDYLRITPRYTASVLARHLEEGNDEERAIAACYLYKSGDKSGPTLDALARAALSDPSPWVRYFSVQSISILDHSRLKDLMPRLVKDIDPDVRWSALAGFAAGGSVIYPEGTPFLIEALDDPVAKVRKYAYQRLKGNTRQTFPFDPDAPREQRLKEQAKWREWWDGL